MTTTPLASLARAMPSAVELTLADGTLLRVRPITPDDADLERAFVTTLSDEARYFRFFYRLQELTPSMLARFTHVDYERDMALAAVIDLEQGPAFVAVARYVGNPDDRSAEFAIVVADAWQRRGIGRALMQQLIGEARRRGLERLQGAVLRENTDMLRFVTGLGFRVDEEGQEPNQVRVTLDLDASA